MKSAPPTAACCSPVKGSATMTTSPMPFACTIPSGSTLALVGSVLCLHTAPVMSRFQTQAVPSTQMPTAEYYGLWPSAPDGVLRGYLDLLESDREDLECRSGRGRSAQR